MKSGIRYFFGELLICIYVFYSLPNNYVTSGSYVLMLTVLLPVMFHYRYNVFAIGKPNTTVAYLTNFRKLLNGQKNKLTSEQLFTLYSALVFIILSSIWLLIALLFLN